jgi:hypothetical protein
MALAQGVGVLVGLNERTGGVLTRMALAMRANPRGRRKWGRCLSRCFRTPELNEPIGDIARVQGQKELHASSPLFVLVNVRTANQFSYITTRTLSGEAPTPLAAPVAGPALHWCPRSADAPAGFPGGGLTRCGWSGVPTMHGDHAGRGQEAESVHQSAGHHRFRAGAAWPCAGRGRSAASGPLAKRRDDLGSATFVPALTQINDQGAVIRRVATWTEFDDDQRELLARFQQWRLVVRKGEADGGTVEVVHEAPFREWTSLKGWLEPERARLEVLRLLRADAATWDRSGRDPAFLNHRDKRLGGATAVIGIERYHQRLGQLEFDYVAECKVAGRLAHRRTRRVQALFGVLAALLLLGPKSAPTYVKSVDGILKLTPQRGHFTGEPFQLLCLIT